MESEVVFFEELSGEVERFGGMYAGSKQVSVWLGDMVGTYDLKWEHLIFMDTGGYPFHELLPVLRQRVGQHVTLVITNATGQALLELSDRYEECGDTGLAEAMRRASNG